MDQKNVLSNFLRKLADDIEKENLPAEDLQRVGEFYIDWVFKMEKESEVSEKEFLSFFTMGWYVYKQLLQNENCTN